MVEFPRRALQIGRGRTSERALYTGLGASAAPAWQLLEHKPVDFAGVLARWRENTSKHARYRFRARADDDGRVGEISIYGPIGEDFFGEGITARSFEKGLKDLGAVDTIELHVDSPGGHVTDARTIYTMLTQHGATINVKIDGAAASAASFVAMAGDHISIAEGGFVMIHEARGLAMGTADDLDKAAAVIRAINETIVDTYTARTSIERRKIVDWMKEETWLVGKDAVKAGFADEVMPNKRATARVGAYAEAFAGMPSELLPRRRRARELVEQIKQGV